MTLPPEREIGRELAGAMHRSTGSYELVIAAIAAAGLGFWIDTVIGTRPIVMIVFAVAGFIGAGYSIYLKYQADMAKASTDRQMRDSGSEGRATHTDDSVLRANASGTRAGVASPQGEHTPLVSEANGSRPGEVAS